MLFNSWQFLLFLLFVFVVYFLLPKRKRHFFLLFASYVFYGFWNWTYIFLILGTTLVSYLCAFFIFKYKEKKKVKVTLLVTSIVTSLLALFFFKYFNFVASSVTSIINFFGGKTTFNPLDIILPVGISFYTFQTISYVVDVYSSKIEAEKNPIYYALYVSFFPQLVAGPIERPSDLIPQFKENDFIKIENISIGLRYMIQGYVKKIVIADFLATIVNSVFNDLSSTNGLLVIIGVISFALQIYGDFSGYSDIALGVGKLFNINLSKNFDKPYSSTSIKEFWRRWHITLNSWFKDYLYIPMGGSKVSYFRWGVNILVVFLLSGLWHGAALTFIIFGLIHAIYQIVGRATKKIRDNLWIKLKVNPEGRFIHYLRMIITFILVCYAWIPFRANSFNDMLLIYKNLFTNWNITSSSLAILDFSWVRTILLVFAIGLFFVSDNIANLPFKQIWLKDIIYILLIWIIMFTYFYLKSTNVDSTFIYFQF